MNSAIRLIVESRAARQASTVLDDVCAMRQAYYVKDQVDPGVEIQSDAIADGSRPCFPVGPVLMQYQDLASLPEIELKAVAGGGIGSLPVTVHVSGVNNSPPGKSCVSGGGDSQPGMTRTVVVVGAGGCLLPVMAQASAIANNKVSIVQVGGSLVGYTAAISALQHGFNVFNNIPRSPLSSFPIGNPLIPVVGVQPCKFFPNGESQPISVEDVNVSRVPLQSTAGCVGHQTSTSVHQPVQLPTPLSPDALPLKQSENISVIDCKNESSDMYNIDVDHLSASQLLVAKLSDEPPNAVCSSKSISQLISSDEKLQMRPVVVITRRSIDELRRTVVESEAADNPSQQVNGQDWMDVPVTREAVATKQEPIDNDDSQDVVCNECGKEFSSKSVLVQHQRFYSGELYSCRYCGKSFCDKESLVRHETLETGMKYSCNKCDKLFTELRQFKDHMNMHSKDIKLYACSRCDKTFCSEKRLHYHEASHVGTYICDFCGKHCSSPSKLRIHGRSHTQHGPFQCRKCDKSYASSSCLMRHSMVHAREKAYECHCCNERFALASSLVRHMKDIHWDWAIN